MARAAAEMEEMLFNLEVRCACPYFVPFHFS